MSKFEGFRHGLRYVVNGVALAAAVAVLPEFGAFVPAAHVHAILGGVAVANTVLSMLRGLFDK